jgi:DNA-binding MarR family transcriptional regulator
MPSADGGSTTSPVVDAASHSRTKRSGPDQPARAGAVPAALGTMRPQVRATTPPPPVRSDPRLLSDAQQHAWRRLIELVVRLPAALERQLQRDAGMSHLEYRILAILCQAPDAMLSLSPLAVQSHASLPRLSRAITRLEWRGWIERRPSPHDARVTFAALTPTGYEEVGGAAPAHISTVRKLVYDGLDDSDVFELVRLCEAIIHRLDDETP